MNDNKSPLQNVEIVRATLVNVKTTVGRISGSSPIYNLGIMGVQEYEGIEIGLEGDRSFSTRFLMGQDRFNKQGIKIGSKVRVKVELLE